MSRPFESTPRNRSAARTARSDGRLGGSADPRGRHAMPPGGFRLAVVNALGLAEGRAARNVLAAWYGLPAGG